MKPTESQLRLEQPIAPRSRLRVFYGWWIATACFIVLTLSSGIGFYGLSVFLPALEQEFRTSPTLISLGATVFFVVFGLAGPYVGRWLDRLGARPVMVAGSTVFGLGMVFLALSRELWQTYFAYAVIAVGFGGIALVPTSALISTWFRARRGLAMSLAMSGISVGGVVVVPLSTHLILAYGWRFAALVLAALVWAIGVPLCALVIRRRPEDLGLLPDGAAQPPPADQDAAPGGVDWTLATARRTRAFWALTVGYLLVNVAQTGVLMHQIRFLTYGTPAEGAISPQAAAFAVSATALASIFGRLALGAVIDRLNRRRVAVGVILLQAAATAGLLFARGDLALVYVMVLVFGLGMGCVLMLQALLVSDLFGVTSFGEIYGATMLVATVGMAAGPWLSGLLFELSGSYDPAFAVFATLALLAAASIALSRPELIEERKRVPVR